MLDRWNEIMKGQPEWLEIPVEPALFERAESAVKAMGLKLEDVVLAFLLKLANDGISAVGISPEDFANARLMRERDEERRMSKEHFPGF